MALPQFLTAMRQLIVDETELPSDAAERRRWMRAQFADLSASEVDRLLAMPPERVEVYRHTIFSGMRGQAEAYLPLATAMIERARRSIAPPKLGAADKGAPDNECGDRVDEPDPLELFELMRDMHRRMPWRSHSSRELARNFQAYMQRDHQPLLEAWPMITDLLEYEATGLEVYFAADVDEALWQPLTREDFDALLALEVGELLETPVLCPAFVQVRNFAHDVAGMNSHWLEHESLPEDDSALFAEASPSASDGGFTLACGRHFLSLAAIWAELDDATEATLARLPRDKPFTLNDLANVYLEEHAGAGEDPGGADEAALFQAFFRFVVRWLECGVLLRGAAAEGSRLEG